MKLEEFNLIPAVEPLQSWFSLHARTLPWRSDPTPYHVWISEIMLQQTRVEAVKAYYARFMETLPDVNALAACDEETYLKLWEGLGYYSRVRNLHKAAVEICANYGGELPADFALLRKLPGIGDYTAGAIASNAFELPEPAVDGNVLRVLMRLTGDDSDIMQQSTKNRLQTVLRELMQHCRIEQCATLREMPAEGDTTETGSASGCTRTAVIPVLRPRVFTQALMELGAIVCVPNGAPHCEECPWKVLCIARKEDRISELPVKTKAKERRIEPRTVLILRDAKTAAIHKRPAKGLLARLWELPNRDGHMTSDEVISYVKSIGFTPLKIEELPPAKHIFSHVEWHMIGYRVKIEEEAFATDEQLARRAEEELRFVDADTLAAEYAVPSAFRGYTPYIS